MYDVIVVGAGHSGCEAALAAARLGARTLLITMNLDTVALMPCNPSIGGPAKAQLVREIDALGGEMARNIDRTFIQIRMLNTGKGPAARAPRAQADKRLYSLAMKHTLERQPNLDLKQALVEELKIAEDGLEVDTSLGWSYRGRTVVLTTGTSLCGRVIVGDKSFSAGRSGEFAAEGLSRSLRRLGLDLGRLKTGTPPRIDARTIDFSKTEVQPGSETPLYFSLWPALRGPPSTGSGQRQDGVLTGPPSTDSEPALSTAKGQRQDEAARGFPSPNPVYPLAPSAWRPQVPCYLVRTNEATHEVIRSNLHRAPLFTGQITGVGPRYCPSIEDKIVKFPHKPAHPLFLEPEGWQTTEVYVQGANTSLPQDVQLAMLRTIPALEHVEIVRTGYAIEYDFVPPSQTAASLESKLVPGLFLAGQVNGTTGYEEAAAQGLIAGINAALKVADKPPLILRRDQAYIGVMVDDLVTRDLTEPYRALTSRAEYRLLLRQDNADLRLSHIGYALGLVEAERQAAVETARQAIAGELERLGRTYMADGATALELLRRQETAYSDLVKAGLGIADLSSRVVEQVEIEAKYWGYMAKQRRTVERVQKLEARHMPQGFDYEAIPALRREARQRLARFQPATLGQASRLEGVTPADLAVLMVHLERGSS